MERFSSVKKIIKEHYMGTYNRNLLKRIMAVALCAFITITYMPVMAYAFEEQPAAAYTKAATEAVSALPNADDKDADELLWGYLDKAVKELTAGENPSGKNMLRSGSKARRISLDKYSEYTYELLRKQIEAFIDPQETEGTASSVFFIPFSEILGHELNMVQIDTGSEVLDVYEVSNEDWEIINSIDGKAVINALLADLPYELYWFDKTKEYSYGPEPSEYWVGEGDIAGYFEELPGMQFALCVAASYSSSAQEGITDADIKKLRDVKDTIYNAEEILASLYDENDISKLEGYRDAICSLTDYDHEAAENDQTPYGDPWQMIYVFDKDEETNVVCEGYSKAFQFLCDHTSFDGNIECDSVAGTMIGGTGAGDHMWNVLHMDDGRNYIADITNSDEGGIGSDGGLFISPALEGGSVEKSYQYDVDGDGEADITYTYDGDTLNLFSESELEMSTLAYGEDDPDNPDYDVWFDHEGNQVYTDGTLDFVLNVDKLGDDWADHFDIDFVVGQKIWNDETEEEEWIEPNPFSENKEYSIIDGHVVRLNGSMLKSHTGESIAIEATVKVKGEDTVVCMEDGWAEIAEAWEDHGFPGYYDENEEEFKAEVSLLRGWDEYIDKHVEYQGGRAEFPFYSGEFTVSDVKVKSGNSVVIEEDENGSGWNVRAVEQGDSTVRITFTDEEGKSVMESPYDFTVHVVNDVYEVTIDSTEGKFRVGPGESISLRAYAVHRYTEEVDDEGNYEERADQDDLSYEWVLEDDSIASLTQDSSDPAKAVLKFKSADELQGYNGGTSVTVIVKYKGEAVASTFDYYSVGDEYVWIEPRTIDPNADYKDVIEVDLKTWIKESGADARQVPGDISYTWMFDEGAGETNFGGVLIEEGIPDDTGTSYTFRKIGSHETSEASHFRITRRTDGYSRIVLRADWGMNQSVWHAFYFDPKSYSIELKGYDDKVISITEGESTTLSYDVSGFSEGTEFDAAIATWGEDDEDWIDVEGLPEGAISVKPAAGGFKNGFSVTLSEDTAAALISKNISSFNLLITAYKNGKALYSEESKPITVRRADWEPELFAAASDGNVYNEDNNTLIIEPGKKVFVSFLTGGQENLDNGLAPVAGFNEPCDENGDPITDEAGVPIGDLSKAGFTVVHRYAEAEYSGTNEKLTDDAYGIVIDTTGLEAGTSADLSYYLYKYEGEDFWSYFRSDEFKWTDMEIAQEKILTVRVAHKLKKTDAVAATCTTAGNDAYWHCEECGKYFSDAEGKNEIAENSWVTEALDHDWDAPTYTWADDCSSVSARRVCKRDAAHAEEKTVQTTSSIDATSCEVEKHVTYTANFDAPFETQTKTETIPAGSHVWDAGTESWPDNETEQGVKTYTCNVCGETKTEPLKSKLDMAKDAALEELRNVKVDDYSGAERTNVENALAKAETEIENAGTIADVNTAKTTALNTIKAQKNDAQKAAEESSTPQVTPAQQAPPAPVEITDLPAVKISKPAAAKKKITVKWKKVSKKNLKKISGIQIQVATDPGFTNIVKATTAGKKKTSKVIKGLQPKTKYYVRIRAYAPGDHYSVWKTKSAKVK